MSKKIQVYIDEDLYKRIMKRSKKPYNVSETFGNIIHKHDKKDEDEFKLFFRKFSRLDTRLEKIENLIFVLIETMSQYLKLYLMNNPLNRFKELDKSALEQVELNINTDYESLVSKIRNKLYNGGTLSNLIEVYYEETLKKASGE